MELIKKTLFIVFSFAIAFCIVFGSTAISSFAENSDIAYCQYKQYWYGKSEGWHKGASNISDVKKYITPYSDKMNLNIPYSAGMNSQQININYSMEGTEKTSAINALTEAVNGSGIIYLKATLYSVKNGKGDDLFNVSFQANLCGGKLKSGTVSLQRNVTKTIMYDVSEIEDIEKYAQSSVQILFQDPNWGAGLTEINADFSFIFVLPYKQPTTAPTTVAPTTAPKTEYAFPEYEDGSFAFVIGERAGSKGKQISIPLLIENNPGIWGFSFGIKYDPAFLSAVTKAGGNADYICGNVFENGSIVTGPVQKTADGFEYISVSVIGSQMKDYTSNGTVLSLKFIINSELHDQKKSIISFVDFSTVCNLDGENIDATYKCGKAGITVGDVNDDNDINQKDILLLKKYLAKWNVSVDSMNSDVTSDGEINQKDVLLLRKYLAKWNVDLG